MIGASSAAFRSLLIYGVCLPLAIFLGYLITTPLDLTSLTAVGVVVIVLSIPLLLKWHHPILVTSLNMSLVIFLVPGKPPIWLALAAISLCIGIFQTALRPEHSFVRLPAVTRPLLLLTLVVLITARLTGMGLQIFGGGVYG